MHDTRGGHARVIQHIQGAAGGIMIAMMGSKRGHNELTDRFMLTKLRHEGELLVDKAEAVESHLTALQGLGG